MQNQLTSSRAVPNLHRIFAFLLLLAFAPLALAQTASNAPPDDQAVRERVDSLVKQMTLEEKVGQLSQLFRFAPSKEVDAAVATGQVGSLLFVTEPAVINNYQHIAVEQSRLHIPLIFGFDVIHGFRTIFPAPIAMAASWDPAGVVREQAIAAKEARSVGIHWAFAPMLDIARDPRWGRIVEGAGEDPYLGSAMAAAQVRGFQGDYIGAPDHLLACMKHYAAYGAAEGGRDYDASYLPETLLYNVYLRPFHAAVQAGIGSAMSAYMDLNDVPATGNRWLLYDVLRDQWKFSGFVVSDANAVKSLETHGYAKDLHDAAVIALRAGVNMEMAIGFTAYGQNLSAAVQKGEITLAQIDEAVRPILEMKVRLGLFEHPYVDEARSQQILTSPEHRTAARVAAERSAVLLRNEGGLLPLKKDAYKKIAVIGPLADSQTDTLGSWVFQPNLQEAVTVLAGLRNKLSGRAELSFTPGVQISRKIPSFFDEILHRTPPPVWTPEHAKEEMAKAVGLAAASNLAILVLGENQDMSGEAASRESLQLPGQEEQLLEAVVATGKPVVLVLLNGRPLDIRWAAQHVPAILEAWYPGTQGGNAVANLLFGDAIPGGKLPITWPRDSGQIPINYAHNTTQAPENQGKRYWDEESTPLFPFGFGLSYSTFRFTDLKLNRDHIKPGESLDVSVEVENTGTATADEVPQLYIHQQYGGTSRPVRELKGFERITLAAHEKRTVHFSLGTPELTYWSTAKKDWVEEPSTFDVWVGGDSTASLHATFVIAP
ncbi:MAG TPA: beta-glucosidase BglX [Candidatus Limnocylindrales bacterium]|nr:beta-glucosidase BglX [Candidatus Limnocylindrales bacterium]